METAHLMRFLFSTTGLKKRDSQQVFFFILFIILWPKKKMFLLPAKKGIKCPVAISQGPANGTTTTPIKCEGARVKRRFRSGLLARYALMGGGGGERARTGEMPSVDEIWISCP